MSVTVGRTAPQCDVVLADRVLVVRGDLDLPCAAHFLSVAFVAFQPGAIVDLREVPFVDSAGIAALLELRRRAGGSAAAATLIGVQDNVLSLLGIAGLVDLFTLRSEPPR
jgi:anti-anti-sigma factor